MSIAKQVPAKNLCPKMARETMTKVVNSAAAELFQTVPANTDSFSPRLIVRYPTSTITVGVGASPSFTTEAATIVSKLLGITPYQQNLLEKGASSITANEYKRVSGADAVLTTSSEPGAAVMLHSLGFSRVRGEGSIVSPRFIKALKRENGCAAVAIATVENVATVTHINLSFDADA